MLESLGFVPLFAMPASLGYRLAAAQSLPAKHKCCVVCSKISVQTPRVPAEMSFCTVSTTKKTSQSPHEALLYRARANQVSTGSLCFNTDELFQPLVVLQADASYVETEELAYSCVPLLSGASNSSALMAQPAMPWLVSSKDGNLFSCLCI